MKSYGAGLRGISISQVERELLAAPRSEISAQKGCPVFGRGLGLGDLGTFSAIRSLPPVKKKMV